MQCSSTTKSGRQCRCVVYKDGRCYNHRLSKCMCKTKSGRSCRNSVYEGRRCYFHRLAKCTEITHSGTKCKNVVHKNDKCHTHYTKQQKCIHSTITGKCCKRTAHGPIQLERKTGGKSGPYRR